MKAVINRLILLLIFLSCTLTATAQTRFFPPNWFKGLQEQKFELMIYREEGFGIEPQVRLDQDIEFRAFQLGSSAVNDRYLFIEMNLEQLKKDALGITINGETYSYTFKDARQELPNRLNPSDAIYLITADRFANGDPMNDRIAGMNEKKYGREYPFGRHGGDLQGIIDKLSYIKDMGFTATWASPLMSNDEFKESYHGYAITDHYNIDPRLGSLGLYHQYVDRSHRMGMKVIMDVVYNHVGSQHLFHLDPPDSSFFHFDMKETRSNFRAVNVMDPHVSKADQKKFSEGWFDDHMPDVNQKQEQFANFLIQNSLWWILEFGIDAFRIDTYAYPDQDFMAELGRRIKLERPNFFLFGEVWVHHPEIQSYFAGSNPFNPNNSHLDGLTDFQFRYALKESLDRTQGWNDGIAKLYYRLAADYLYENPNNLVTFIDNHDEPRIFGELHQDVAKLKLALGVLYTMRGIPCTYYGTEILMKETENHGLIRQDFPGGFDGDTINKFQTDQLKGAEAEVNQYLRDLLAWRANSDAIRNGSFLHFVPEYDVYTYFRISEREVVMVQVNSHPKEAREVDLHRFREVWPKSADAKDVLSQEPAPNDVLKLEPMSVRIFSLKR